MKIIVMLKKKDFGERKISPVVRDRNGYSINFVMLSKGPEFRTVALYEKNRKLLDEKRVSILITNPAISGFHFVLLF